MSIKHKCYGTKYYCSRCGNFDAFHVDEIELPTWKSETVLVHCKCGYHYEKQVSKETPNSDSRV
jgi:hypothetical protein